ncbi:MAG: hypothetical protein ACRCTZ_07865 [Sarcina sp.]
MIQETYANIEGKVYFFKYDVDDVEYDIDINSRTGIIKCDYSVVNTLAPIEVLKKEDSRLEYMNTLINHVRRGKSELTTFNGTCKTYEKDIEKKTVNDKWIFIIDGKEYEEIEDLGHDEHSELAFIEYDDSHILGYDFDMEKLVYSTIVNGYFEIEGLPFTIEDICVGDW